MRLIRTADLGEGVPGAVMELVLVPAGENRFLVRLPGERRWTSVLFDTLPDGTRYLHFGARAALRTA
ncbi:hypothetical protein ACIBCM_03895 [Streptomyces sp. NPDC051018]|uniref:hypothetical protein n=1 Tax=Streptomyces sp. NPDC051018 TaxID=3365639 RepID=UPI00378F27A8